MLSLTKSQLPDISGIWALRSTDLLVPGNFPLSSELGIPKMNVCDKYFGVKSEPHYPYPSPNARFYLNSSQDVASYEFSNTCFSPDTNSQIPSASDYAGNYGFEISFGPQNHNSCKSALWTFSPIINKLYVKMAATCPVRFKTLCPVPNSCFIRATPIFRQPEHVKQIVTRCPNHAHSRDKDSMNENHPAPNHLIRCEHPDADYQTHPSTGRQSVVVPFDSPQVGTEYLTLLYNFMCYGSCVGGLNRRPIMVIFTFEKDGLVFGRRAIEVRICACPGRDRKNEESPSPGIHSRVKRSSLSSKPFYMPPSKVSKAIHLSDDDDQSTYTISVVGRRSYDQLLDTVSFLRTMGVDIQLGNNENGIADNSVVSTIPDNPVVSTTNIEKENGMPGMQGEYLQKFSSNGIESCMSVATWLSAIGCSQCLDAFLSKNILHVAQLHELSIEEFENMDISKECLRRILDSIKMMKSDGKPPVTLIRSSSDASTTILPNGEMETRYTLKHTISLLSGFGDF